MLENLITFLSFLGLQIYDTCSDNGGRLSALEALFTDLRKEPTSSCLPAAEVPPVGVLDLSEDLKRGDELIAAAEENHIPLVISDYVQFDSKEDRAMVSLFTRI